MYLAISVVAAICAFLAAVQTRNAKRLGEDLRQKTVEAESFQLTAQTIEQRLHTEEAARMQLADRITKVETALRESEDTACRLRQELQTERRKNSTPPRMHTTRQSARCGAPATRLIIWGRRTVS
jgi:septal ring factor EnvC (AmiA/AmiB activator)